MTNRRRNLGIQIRTPGGDNPLLIELVAPGPYFRGVATSGIRFVGKGGVQPYAFSVLSTSSNSLPPGLSIANPLTGEVTGTPTQAGRFSFIAQIADSAAATFTRSFTIEIKAQLFWQGPPPPIGELTVPYRYQFRVLDGSGTLLTSGFTSTGTIPPGLSLSAAGLLSGTPTAPAGISYFTVHATDGTDSIDIPIALEIVEAPSLSFVEDRDPPPGWGGAPGTWLPSMIRNRDWIAHLIITGGVAPFSLEPGSPAPPTGINVNSRLRTVSGKTTDAASTTIPRVFDVIVTDALGGQHFVARNVFIIDSEQGRITPRHEGVDVAGGDGFTVLDFKAAPGGTVDVTNDGHVTTVMIGATVEGSVATINDVAPDSAGNLQIGGVFTDSNGDLYVPDYVRDVSSASPGTIEVDNSDPQHPVLDHQVSGVTPGLYGTSNKVARIGVTDEGHVYSASEQAITAGGSANAGVYYFGDGSDGTVLMDGTNTFPAFASKAGSVYTLTRDLYCDTLQINGGAQLKTGNYRIFCYTGILDCTGAASPAIFGNGNNGANASGAALGSGGAQGSITATLGQGGAGGGGANGGTGVGGNGVTGGNPGGSVSNGGTGGPPGNVSNSGGSGTSVGGASPQATATLPFVWQHPDADMYVVTAVGSGAPPWSAIRGGGGGSGGGAGGGNGVQSGGGGAGGGGGGNVMYIAARDIYCGSYLLAAVDGGTGGNGGNGQGASNTGGGGAGNGGGGGVLHIVHATLSGPGGCTLSANGGTAGNGGNGTTGGNAGKGGTGGTSGLINDFNVGNGTVVATPTNRALVAGSANSGQTGGGGGAAVRTLNP